MKQPLLGRSESPGGKAAKAPSAPPFLLASWFFNANTEVPLFPPTSENGVGKSENAGEVLGSSHLDHPFVSHAGFNWVD